MALTDQNPQNDALYHAEITRSEGIAQTDYTKASTDAQRESATTDHWTRAHAIDVKYGRGSRYQQILSNFQNRKHAIHNQPRILAWTTRSNLKPKRTTLTRKQH